jgi:hypothetical protein
VLAQEFAGECRADLASIMGPGDDATYADWVEQLVERSLGEPVVGALFAFKSAGAVFGVRLRSGEHVVLKLFWPRLSQSELLAMEQCLDHVLSHDFPAPRPRARVFRTDRGLFAAIYEHVDGVAANPHEEAVRREMARRLAELCAIMTKVDPRGLAPSPVTADALWWPSHREGVDLERYGGEWIDARAHAAQALVRAARLPLLPAHLDWRVQNFIWREDRICAVLDWDSLHAASEPDLVGRTAAIFTAQWELPFPPSPTHDEARAFLDEYETARGRRFGAEERRVVAASAEYVIAHLARQEYSYGHPPSEGYLELLRTCSSKPLLS